ncbi:MAG: hypothetical protein AAB489_04755 [Patescibacteria group bacterium]
MGDLTPSEKSLSRPAARSEKAKLIVAQPKQIKELGLLLKSIEGLAQRVGESTGEDMSADLGATGAPATATGAKRASPRDQSIASLPEPAIMKEQLEKHIEKEVKKLTREAKKIARLARPGAAFSLNELYARIRRLNALLHELIEASVEIIRRLFIRVFVDKQPII